MCFTNSMQIQKHPPNTAQTIVRTMCNNRFVWVFPKNCATFVKTWPSKGQRNSALSKHNKYAFWGHHISLSFTGIDVGHSRPDTANLHWHARWWPFDGHFRVNPSAKPIRGAYGSKVVWTQLLLLQRHRSHATVSHYASYEPAICLCGEYLWQPSCAPFL